MQWGVEMRRWQRVPLHITAVVKAYRPLKLRWSRTMFVTPTFFPLPCIAEAEGRVFVVDRHVVHVIRLSDGAHERTWDIPTHCVAALPNGVVAASIGVVQQVWIFQDDMIRTILDDVIPTSGEDDAYWSQGLAFTKDGTTLAVQTEGKVHLIRLSDKALLFATKRLGKLLRIGIFGAHLYAATAYRVFVLRVLDGTLVHALDVNWELRDFTILDEYHLLVYTALHVLLLRACDGAVLQLWSSQFPVCEQHKYYRPSGVTVASSGCVLMAFGPHLEEFELTRRCHGPDVGNACPKGLSLSWTPTA